MSSDDVATGPVDQERIAAAVREILLAIGEDPDRDGLLDTPARVARMYAEVFAGLRESPDHHLQVVFEADDHGVATGWSVIVRGKAEVLYGSEEIEEADRAGLYPWLATVKLRYVRIRPTTVSGRRFVFGPEPDAGSVPG